MAILKNCLSDLKASKKLMQLSLQRPDDIFYCQIIDYNEDFILVRKIRSDNGADDGFALAFYDNIYTIAWEGELLQQLEILITEKEYEQSLIKIQNININNDFFKIIKRINSLYGYLSIYDQYDADDFYFGQMKDVDEDFLHMKILGDKSSMDDKNIIIRLEDIGRIEFGGIYDENMLKLHQIKKRIRKQG